MQYRENPLSPMEYLWVYQCHSSKGPCPREVGQHKMNSTISLVLFFGLFVSLFVCLVCLLVCFVILFFCGPCVWLSIGLLVLSFCSITCLFLFLFYICTLFFSFILWKEERKSMKLDESIWGTIWEELRENYGQIIRNKTNLIKK